MSAVNGKRGRNGRLTPKEVATIQRRAFVHCLKATGTTHEQAAREMDVRRYTVQRYLTGKSEVNSKFVLRSGRLWRAFHVCVGKLRHAARKL